MPKLQMWDLKFKLPDLQLDAAGTFEVFCSKLSFSPVDVNNSEGHLFFKMQADTIDEHKAKTIGMEWIQRNLVDSHLLVFGLDLKPEFLELKLLNESELKQTPRTSYRDLPARAAIRGSLPIADMEKSLKLPPKLEAHANRELLERSRRWFRKARDADDDVDRFVSQWIAFNSLYGMFDPDKKGDLIAIKNLINEHPSTEKIRGILDAHEETIRKLASKGLKDWHEQKDYSEELKSLIGNQDVRRTLMAVGLCLFIVRNEVFHGGTTPSEEMHFIRECSQLLERIYRECYCSYVGLT